MAPSGQPHRSQFSFGQSIRSAVQSPSIVLLSRVADSKSVAQFSRLSAYGTEDGRLSTVPSSLLENKGDYCNAVGSVNVPFTAEKPRPKDKASLTLSVRG